MPRRAIPSYAQNQEASFVHAPVQANSTQPLLEALRTELAKSARSEQLEEEVVLLRQQLELAQLHAASLEDRLSQSDESVVRALAGLRTTVRERVRNLDAELRLSQLRATEHLEDLLAEIEAHTPLRSSARAVAHAPISTSEASVLRREILPTTEIAPAAVEVATKPANRWRIWPRREKVRSTKQVAIPKEPKVAKAEPQKAEDNLEQTVSTHPRKPKKRIYRIAVRTALATCIAVLGWQTWTFIRPTTEIGAVAGTTTEPESSPEPSQPTYEESFAELPFGATEWTTYNSANFGVKVDYPKNTSNLVQNPGGNNLWFLRRNGYLFKVTRIESDQPLDLWWSNNRGSFANPGQTFVKGNLKTEAAIVLTSIERSITSGTSYFVKKNSYIYQIWVKDEPATTDDGKRVERMLDSLTFLSNQE